MNDLRKMHILASMNEKQLEGGFIRTQYPNVIVYVL